MKKRLFKIVKSSILIQSLLIGLVTIVIIFPDVFFRNAALSITDNFTAAVNNGPEARFYPQLKYRQWWQSYSDNGGAYFQSEPMMEFVKNSLWNGESPYWNPYSGLGNLGPETMVDMKFSPQTLLYAILKGGSYIYNLTLLLLYLLASCFIYLIVRKIFKLTVISGISAVFFYLLCGYSSANVASNVYQSYLLAPIHLYFLLSVIEKPSIKKIVPFSLSLILLLMCTFMPTTIITLLTVYFVGLSYLIHKIKEKSTHKKQLSSIFLTIFLSVILSAFAVAPIYLPILENMSFTNMLGRYAQRIYKPVQISSLLSLFTPSHFFESYNVISVFDSSFYYQFDWRTIYHIGIVPFFIISIGFYFQKNKHKIFLAISVLAVIFAIARVFGLPLFSAAINYLPVIGKIASQYWWPLFFIPLTCLLAFGIENIRLGKYPRWLAFLPLTVITIAVLITGRLYFSWYPNMNIYKYKFLILLVFLSLVSWVLILIKNKYTCILLVLLMVAELLFSTKHFRLQVNDFYRAPFPEVSFLKENIGYYRTASFNYAIPISEQGSAFKISQLSANNEGNSKEFSDFFWKTFNLKSPELYSSFPSLTMVQDSPKPDKINFGLLDFVGVKYIVTPVTFNEYDVFLVSEGYKRVFQNGRANIYESKKVWPRAFLVKKDNVKVNKNGSIALLEFNRKMIEPANINSFKNTEIRLSGELKQESYLILTDQWQENWKAIVNGQQSRLLKMDIFRAVKLMPGKFQVTMIYEPYSLPYAIMLFLFSLSFISFIGIFGHKLSTLCLPNRKVKYEK